MSGFGEDEAYSQVNIDVLEKELGVDTSEERSMELEEIRELRNQIAIPEQEDPDNILRANIERTNGLLDILEQSIRTGGQSNARLFEVAGQLINAVSSASTAIQASGFGQNKHEYNMRLLALKEQEVFVKQALAQERLTGKKPGGNGKVMVMDRESLLNMMNEGEIEVEIQSVGDEEPEEA